MVFIWVSPRICYFSERRCDGIGRLICPSAPLALDQSYARNGAEADKYSRSPYTTIHIDGVSFGLRDFIGGRGRHFRMIAGWADVVVWLSGEFQFHRMSGTWLIGIRNGIAIASIGLIYSMEPHQLLRAPMADLLLFVLAYIIGMAFCAEGLGVSFVAHAAILNIQCPKSLKAIRNGPGPDPANF